MPKFARFSMASRREALVLIGVGAAAAAAGWYFGPRLRSDPSVADVAALLAVPLRDIEGRPVSLSNRPGRVLVCNFWATWCSPCREEIPALNRIHGRMSASGVEIIGIAVDQARNVADFLKTVPIAYAVALGDSGLMEVMRRLGNPGGGLPFTVVLDRHRAVTERTLGVISEATLERRLSALVAPA